MRRPTHADSDEPQGTRRCRHSGLRPVISVSRGAARPIAHNSGACTQSQSPRRDNTAGLAPGRPVARHGCRPDLADRRSRRDVIRQARALALHLRRRPRCNEETPRCRRPWGQVDAPVRSGPFPRGHGVARHPGSGRAGSAGVYRLFLRARATDIRSCRDARETLRGAVSRSAIGTALPTVT